MSILFGNPFRSLQHLHHTRHYLLLSLRWEACAAGKSDIAGR
jgi:hypothetical protein